MGSLNTALAQHGYAILAAVVFLEAIGVPVPAAVALLIAGGAVAHGVLQAQYVIGIALFAMLAGDTLMFILGRYTGWRLLGLLCQGSRRLDPNALHQSGEEMPQVGSVFVYCTCVRQATSTRVARELQTMLLGKSVRVTVIEGGLRAWVKAGLPVEEVPPEELANLPAFE